MKSHFSPFVAVYVDGPPDIIVLPLISTRTFFGQQTQPEMQEPTGGTLTSGNTFSSFCACCRLNVVQVAASAQALGHALDVDHVTGTCYR